MKRIVKATDSITLHDLLTVDAYDESIKLKDNPYALSHELIPDRQTFFGENGLFAKPEANGLVEVHEKTKTQIDLDGLLELLTTAENSQLVFIEGFAGCGKSTLVQYILSTQLNTYNFDYNLYNYNLAAQYDIITRDTDGNSFKRSTILATITTCFIEQFVFVAKNHYAVVEGFVELLRLCEYFTRFSDLFHSFYNTKTFQAAIRNIKKNKDDLVKRLLKEQINQISSSMSVLALDYLLRLSMYKHNCVDKLYICYDNLDAIENSDDLIGFDDKLAKIRQPIDDFINYAHDNNFFDDKATPHFIVLATYRKITASLVGITDQYEEVWADQGRDHNIHHIDATSAFSYKKIVSRRKNYFINRLDDYCGMNNEKKKLLQDGLENWESLNNNLTIMDDKYSCLWNRNYRTCSYIANELFSKPHYAFTECIKFIRDKNPPDGYEESGCSASEKDTKKGENILCTYYGGSAIMLSSICKVFNNYNIWDEFLDLAKLKSSSISYKNVSLSRLILTYIYNANHPISLADMYYQFCSKGLFSYSKLCKILSKMLARNLNGVWRRPIYYACEYIPFEKAEEIEQVLLEQCKLLHDDRNISRNYTFLLCDSGKSYVERLMHEFEFFSNRLSNKNKCLYLYDSVDPVRAILKDVYDAVRTCCDNLLDFRREYISSYGVSKDEYSTLQIHPTTNRKISQLHSERTIFSHIAYLNNVRLYFLDEKITPDIKKRKAYNSLFTEYICKYLDLYAEKILPICNKREIIYQRLKIKANIVKTAENDKKDTSAMFQPISL